MSDFILDIPGVATMCDQLVSELDKLRDKWILEFASEAETCRLIADDWTPFDSYEREAVLKLSTICGELTEANQKSFAPFFERIQRLKEECLQRAEMPLMVAGSAPDTSGVATDGSQIN